MSLKISLLLKMMPLLLGLAGPAWAQAGRPVPPPQHRIPDPALRRLLARQGFLTNGVLNEKSRRWDQLQISGEGIKSLEGIQYFTAVKELYITNTRLQRLDFMPPNVSYFVCSNNQLLTLPPLPPYLHYLVCDHNRLAKLPPLPATLTSLNCCYNRLATLPSLPRALTELYVGHNRLARLPTLPPNLLRLNYFANPIPRSALPAAYRPLPCRAAEQNCQPNTLVNWPILNAKIPDTTFHITGMRVVTTASGGMVAQVAQATVLFQLRGNDLVADTQLNERREYVHNGVKHVILHDTSHASPVNYRVGAKTIQKTIKDIYSDELVLKVLVGDSAHIVDLRYKDLAVNNFTTCMDCETQEIHYTIYTNKEPIEIRYQLDFMGIEPVSRPPNPRPQVQLLDWLYMHNLTAATIPGNELVKHYFRPQCLRDIVRWAR